MDTLGIDLRTLLGQLQGLSTFKCIDLQLVEEEDYVIVRATVGSAYDRSRLIETLRKTFPEASFTHFIQIDPLLNTPFSPTIPFHTAVEKSSEDWSQVFFTGGLHIAEQPFKI